MIDRAISPRYAKVLFDLDCVQGSLEQRLKEFEFIIKIFKNHPKLLRLLKIPHITLDDKKKVLQDFLRDKFDLKFLNFIFYLIQKERLDNLGHIAHEYRLMANERLGVWKVDIVTALPLDVASEARLKEKLEKNFCKKIHLNKKVDPKIVGGAILIIENKMLDWSVTSRLKKLKERLMRVV